MLALLGLLLQLLLSFSPPRPSLLCICRSWLHSLAGLLLPWKHTVRVCAEDWYRSSQCVRCLCTFQKPVRPACTCSGALRVLEQQALASRTKSGDGWGSICTFVVCLSTPGESPSRKRPTAVSALQLRPLSSAFPARLKVGSLMIKPE
jgi:hypothetical protein